MSESYRVAIVGATGAVGTTIREILEERSFPVTSLKLLASHRSAGEVLEFKDDGIRKQGFYDSEWLKKSNEKIINIFDMFPPKNFVQVKSVDINERIKECLEQIKKII